MSREKPESGAARNAADLERVKSQWGDHWSAVDISRELSSCEGDELLPVFRRYLPKEELVIEGGAGLGKWAIFLTGLKYRMIGVEIVRDCVELVKRNFPEVDMRSGNILALDFPDGTFGAYISIGVIEHFRPGPDAAVREAFRVLKPGGKFIVTVPAMNLARTALRPLQDALRPLKEVGFLRKLFGKQPLLPDRPKRVAEERPSGGFPEELHPVFHAQPDAGLTFFEYRFPREAFRECLLRNGFEILELEPIQNDQGFLEDFIYPFFPVEKVEAPGSRVKRAAAMVSGFLRRVDPRICNHQFLCVARKPV